MNISLDIEDALDEVELSSKTYKLDFDNKRIQGHCDGLEAVKQAIKKILLTTRNEFEILYSEDYGSDIQNVITEDYSLETLENIIPNFIYEALLEDDRITNVTDIEMSLNNDELSISFTVETDFGTLQIQEVL